MLLRQGHEHKARDALPSPLGHGAGVDVAVGALTDIRRSHVKRMHVSITTSRPASLAQARQAKGAAVEHTGRRPRRAISHVPDNVRSASAMLIIMLIGSSGDSVNPQCA